jgi:chromate transporter
LPSYGEALRVWIKIGLLSFGGPAGQVALMHKELVEERRWIDEERFLHALNYCMLLPGPEAQQLATYIGWLLHKTRGGLTAGLLFILPGLVSILGLSALYASYRDLALVTALFFGLKAAVLAIVVEAVLRIAKRALKTRFLFAMALLAFVAIFCFDVPFPLLVLGSGLIGLLTNRFMPRSFPAPNAAQVHTQRVSVVDRMAERGLLAHTKPNLARTSSVVAVCLALWAAPLGLLAYFGGSDSVFFQEAIFFSKTAVVTFGGAYAVLAYIAQQAVEVFHWLNPGEMLDGLGLAETTPGPLIMVVQFVGYLGAFRQPGALSPALAGVLGSLVTVWVTFVPCFLWIFSGAPYVEAIRGNRALHAGLSTITASIVGVILNLSLWFGIHVVFRDVEERHWGLLKMPWPVLDSVDLGAALLAGTAMLALFRFKLGLPLTLALSALLGVLWKI